MEEKEKTIKLEGNVVDSCNKCTWGRRRDDPWTWSFISFDVVVNEEVPASNIVSIIVTAVARIQNFIILVCI
jgi:hypothetical protein